MLLRRRIRSRGLRWAALPSLEQCVYGRRQASRDAAAFEQRKPSGATVVLIEDKASGTQLIQELISEGCHGVTCYQPTGDKVMRLHAQTALIENGFVRIPEDAPWLADYLHEMTVFPNGKHDDQADSTAQFLDWFKKPFANQGYYEWLRIKAEHLDNPQTMRQRHRVLLEGPVGMSVQTRSGRHLDVASDGTLELSADDAEPFIRNGWRKLGEWIDDAPPEGEQIMERDKPAGPKVSYAKGSVEWQEQQEEERLARIVAAEEKEKRRLARVAAVLSKKIPVNPQQHRGK